MAYRKVYFRIRTDCYSSGWTSDADRTAFKEESRRLFQELGWAVTFGHNGSCDTAAKDQQDLYLHPSSFSGVIDEASIQPLQEQLSKARTFRCYHVDRYEEYWDLSDEAYRTELEAKRDEITRLLAISSVGSSGAESAASGVSGWASPCAPSGVGAGVPLLGGVSAHPTSRERLIAAASNNAKRAFFDFTVSVLLLFAKRGFA